MKEQFICSECGHTFAKWQGQCSACGSWNTIEENEDASADIPGRKVAARFAGRGSSKAEKFSELDASEFPRTATGYSEFDRVLGGGLVGGSVVLLSGEPGIGKSTLLLQMCAKLAKKHTVLYVSGEESASQIKLRAKRIDAGGDNLYLLTETDVDTIMSEADRLTPDVIIVDSIQTVYNRELNSAPGSVTQVKEGAMSFINKAKGDGCAVILVGHINKEGNISGPKILEHMVDAVLCFEGERSQSYRIIRAEKNRYGSTNEIGVFEMTDEGLCEVKNPSEALMADRPVGASGSCAVCILEGTRPIIAEIQALVTPSVFAAPRRMSNGIDYNRMNLLLAVLEKKLGLKFSANDVYLNVTGGLRMDEPASDLAAALALISSITDKPLDDKLVAFGEIGLSGECRVVSNSDSRIKEAARLGFEKVVLPKRCVQLSKLKDNDCATQPVKSVFDLLTVIGK